MLIPACIRENTIPYNCQEALAAGVAHGRHEEHQRACQAMRRSIVEIADVRFPLIAAFLQERAARLDNFTVLHQFIFVLSTAWTAEDVLRFLIALDDAQMEDKR